MITTINASEIDHAFDRLDEAWQTQGLFLVRGAIDRDRAVEVRGVIRNLILTPDDDAAGSAGASADPMDPMGNTPEAKAARFRKLGDLAGKSPLCWHYVYGSEHLRKLARHFLEHEAGAPADDLWLKFNSTFLKPAKTGSATPWHQDNGLWRDDDTSSFNFWMALDPATKANGCLQFVPGSHLDEDGIVPHVLYADSIHGEIPREKVEEQKQRNGLVHVELQPGDAICWHSNLYHYSPPNQSDHGRIGQAGVYTTCALARKFNRFKQFYVVESGGTLHDTFPPERATLPGEMPTVEPWERLEPEAKAA
ncbi:MAG: phytanoyl-CoA dioxygenase family protein [Planctomycetota bacterium]